MSDFGIALLDTFRAKAQVESQGFATMSAVAGVLSAALAATQGWQRVPTSAVRES